ncbi:hypothetical protein R75465_08536 [Paraburkholderia aspalathi]|nr:hypothetical protein R75465_08536 [Paraburkholderia aspalathi]
MACVHRRKIARGLHFRSRFDSRARDLREVRERSRPRRGRPFNATLVARTGRKPVGVLQRLFRCFAVDNRRAVILAERQFTRVHVTLCVAQFLDLMLRLVTGRLQLVDCRIDGPVGLETRHAVERMRNREFHVQRDQRIELTPARLLRATTKVEAGCNAPVRRHVAPPDLERVVPKVQMARRDDIGAGFRCDRQIAGLPIDEVTDEPIQGREQHLCAVHVLALVHFKQLGFILGELQQRLFRKGADFLQPVIEVLVFQDQRQVIAVLEELFVSETSSDVLAYEPLHEALFEPVHAIKTHALSRKRCVIAKAATQVATQLAVRFRVTIEHALHRDVLVHLERHAAHGQRHHEPVALQVLYVFCDRMPVLRNPVFHGADRAKDVAGDGGSAMHQASGSGSRSRRSPLDNGLKKSR